jgi:putative redox protein
MITTKNEAQAFQVSYTNGKVTAIADAPVDKGGQGAGFSPFDLLEASLGCCITMIVRVYAANHKIPLSNVTVAVEIDRQEAEKTIFNYTIKLEGELSDNDRKRLLEAANLCPVKQALSKTIEFGRKE